MWYDEYTKHCIEIHRIRRGKNWNCCESVGDISQDQINLNQAITDTEHPLSCFIDGITNWCKYAAKYSRNYLAESEKIATTLIELTNKHQDVKWYIMDCIREDYTNTPVLLETWDLMYLMLINNIENILLFEWHPLWRKPILQDFDK